MLRWKVRIDLFGYVKPFAPDLYVREFELYKAIYCGICREMRRRTGLLSSATLSYDMVFLAIARMAATDEKLKTARGRCTVNPFRRRNMILNSPSIEYSARASALLCYHKLRDDLADERGAKKLAAAIVLPFARRAAKKADLEELENDISACLERLSEIEANRVASVDEPADAFGELLGTVFAFGLPEDSGEILYDVGFHLGRFIYAADAAEDWGDDIAMGKYNPFALLYGEDFENEAYRREIHGVLTYSASLAAEALDRLDLSGKDAARNILMNTLCSGLSMRIGFLIGEDCPDNAFPQIDHKNCRGCGKCRKSKKMTKGLNDDKGSLQGT